MRSEKEIATSATTRRSVLKRTAVTSLLTGTAASATSSLTVARSADADPVRTVQRQFITVDFEFDGADDALVMPGRRVYPSFLRGDDGVYVADLDSTAVEFDADGPLLAAPDGLHTLTDSHAIPADFVPETGVATGRTDLVADATMDDTVSITAREPNVLVSFGDASTRIRPQETRDIERSVDVSYRTTDGDMTTRTLDSRLTVENYGVKPIHAHDSRVLIPTDSPGGRHVDTLVGSIKPSARIEGDSRGPAVEIVEFEAANAYGIDTGRQGGEN